VIPFDQVLLKIHSRCNLACDHCYVYEHADQSWRRRPAVMARRTIEAAAGRIAEHAARHGVPRLRLILHGGEALLAGTGVIDHAATAVRSVLPASTRLDLSVQTNGLLLHEEFLELFHRHGIRVGVSLDGDRAANDRHRRFAGGRSSYEPVMRALELLSQERHRALFGGLLCTVDLANEPVATYESLLHFAPPMIDFLLPHGNWTAPPPARVADPRLAPYGDWLIAVFDRWYSATRRETGIRLFESVIDLLLGGRSHCESVGLSPIGLISIETDGAIEQSDALKTVAEGMAATGMNVFEHSFDQALAHPAIRARQAGLAGLGPTCRACPVVAVCGGGLYAHRFSAGSGFSSPSVYCADLYRLITHVRARLEGDLRALSLVVPSRESATCNRTKVLTVS